MFWGKRENKDDTIDIYKTDIRHLIDIISDIPIDSITSKTVFEYKDKYLKIPNRREQKKEYKWKSVSELLQMNVSEQEGFESRSITSLNQSLRRLSTFAIGVVGTLQWKSIPLPVLPKN